MNKLPKKLRRIMMLGGGSLVLGLVMIRGAGGRPLATVENLGVLAVLALGLLWFARKKGAANETSSCMHVVERLSLEQGRTLHLVEVEGRRMLLASHQSGIGLISICGSSQACNFSDVDEAGEARS